LTEIVQAGLRLRGRYSARGYVVALVAVILIPALLLAGWLAVWSAQSERAQLEQSARNQTREVIGVIDREVIGVRNLLLGLAASPSLQVDDLRAFHAQATSVSKITRRQIVLLDRRLNAQVVNTAFPWGAQLRLAIPAARLESEAELVRTERPVVSGVFFGPLIKQYVVSVVVPVFRENELRYSLAGGIPLESFAKILRSLDIHPGQLVTVIDREGIVIARSERHSEFVGTRIKAPMPLDTTGIGRSANRDGIPFHWFNRQSDLTGWYISVGLPDRILEAPSRRAIMSVAVAGSVLLSVAIALSYLWGGQLGQSVGALGIDRKPTREEFEVLFESAPNGVMVMGSDGIIMLVNSQLARKFGYAPADLIGQRVEILVPERLRGGHNEFRKDFARDPQSRPMGAGRELFGRRKDGSEFPVEIALNPIETAAGNLVMATVVDISARKLAEQRLSTALTERDDLRRRFMQAQENERLRLAHELHDQTGQSLTAAMLELKSIESLAKEGEREQLRHLRRQMEEIGKTLHRVAWELRPASIDEIGLAGALGNYISEWSMQYGVEADFYCADPKLDDLSEEIRTTIYRVVQEALTNVAKHAQSATSVSVVVERGDQDLQLMVEDDGCGFDAAASAGPGGGSLGLAGMRERLSLIGGRIEIESSVGAGTTIFARIPLDRARMTM